MAKAGLQSSTMAQNSDIHCLRGYRLSGHPSPPPEHLSSLIRSYRPSNSTNSKVQTQETTAKDPHSKESRPKEAKSAEEKALASPRTNMAKSLEQGKRDRKNKKGRFWKHR